MNRHARQRWFFPLATCRPLGPDPHQRQGLCQQERRVLRLRLQSRLDQLEGRHLRRYADACNRRTSGTANQQFPTSGHRGNTRLAAIGDKVPFASSTINGDSSLSSAAVVSKLYAAYSTALTQSVGAPPPRRTAPPPCRRRSRSPARAPARKSYAGVFIGTFFRDLNQTGSTVTSDKRPWPLSGSYNATYRTSSTGTVRPHRLRRVDAPPSAAPPTRSTVRRAATGVAAALVLTPDKLSSTATINGTSGNVDSISTTRHPRQALLRFKSGCPYRPDQQRLLPCHSRL